ncbi:hypothetical protein [Undibacterium sp.]|uniref:hypothetical protein n=1 Tax=Undibacterium sp. TaxID=1914977 RepID=UPI00374FDD8E
MSMKSKNIDNPRHEILICFGFVFHSENENFWFDDWNGDISKEFDSHAEAINDAWLQLAEVSELYQGLFKELISSQMFNSHDAEVKQYELLDSAFDCEWNKLTFDEQKLSILNSKKLQERCLKEKRHD